MRTEVYINDQLIDLEDETVVAASYGNITFGEINKRKGVKTNTWAAPFSQRNKLVFESSELVGSFSNIPYRKNSIRVEIDGVVVFEGYCTMREAEDNYNIASFAGASDFYSLINSRKLALLDLSRFDHVWNDVNLKNSWNNTEGYIYAFVEYGKEWEFSSVSGTTPIPPDYFLPQIYFHTVVKQIATDAGYTLQGDVLNNERFKKQTIIPNKWPLPIGYGGTFNLSALLPDLTQSKVWLDFANIYGLQFNVDDSEKIIQCDYIDDILFEDPQDWTGKVDRSAKQRTSYSLEYGQTSYLRYKYDSIEEGNSAWQDFQKAITVDDTTLPEEADVYKSEFYLIQDVDAFFFPDGRATTRTFNEKAGVGFGGIWNSATAYVFNGSEGTRVWYNGTYYKSIQTGTNKVPPSEPTYWTPTAEKDIWDIKSRPMYGIITDDVSSYIHVVISPSPTQVTKIINNTDMDWEYTYEHHYRVFKRIIEKTKIVDKLIKLSYSDLNQIDFTRAKLIDGELYLLQEVQNYNLNRKSSTTCSLIRL